MCTLLDSHVHFYAAFEVSAFLDGAAANFARASRDIASASGADVQFKPSANILVVCETDSHNRPLDTISKAVGDSSSWSVTRSDTKAIWVKQKDGNEPTEILLIAGRQIVTHEQLELLAIGTTASIQHGLPLNSTIQQVEEIGGVSVLPWGFGKWLFKRGQVLRSLLESLPADATSSLLMGDNGCRWRASRPKLLNMAERVGVPVIAGSDPLRLSNHACRAGSFGTVLDDNFDQRNDDVAEAVCQSLRELRRTPPTFGACRNLLSFLRDQISLRLGGR